MRFTPVVALAAILSASIGQGQEQRGEARATIEGKTVVVEYGRPFLAGRDMLGQARAGTPWRMGAGASTTLASQADLVFGKVIVPKGDYVLTAVKNDEGAWRVLVSKQGAQGSTAEVPLVSTPLKDSVEQFTIEIKSRDKGGEFSMMWGTAKMSAPFTTR